MSEEPIKLTRQIPPSPEPVQKAMRFPVGGERLAVYNFLASLGFVMQQMGDKHYLRADGLHLHLYGAGSCARLWKDGEPAGDCLLDHLEEYLKKRHALPTPAEA